MKNPFRVSMSLICLSLLTACSSAPETPKQESILLADTATVQAPDFDAPIRLCFMQALNRDTTRVNLVLKGDTVEGTMVWQPYEKDGARGTLSGRRDAQGEMQVLYDYMIEGQQQTETKIMKIEGDKLLLKVGELQDVHQDGHLTFKNAAKAVYRDTLMAVVCE